MKKILGLDIGTNSVGWSLIQQELEKREGRIIAMGSRIIPMGGRDKDFNSGKSVSKTAERREARSARRLLQRYKLRRTRLIKVLKILEWLPPDFPENFKNLEKFNINDYAPFSDKTIKEAAELFEMENVPQDWLVYFIRAKAIKEKIELKEMARLLYHFNQRRGYKNVRGEDSEEEITEEKFPLKEKKIETCIVTQLKESEEKKKNYKIFDVVAELSDGKILTGTSYRKEKPDWNNKKVELEVTKITTKDGEIRYEFKTPDVSDWKKLKEAHEKEIDASGLYIGEYYLKNLAEDKNFRIKGRIIDRSYYQRELDAIWQNQKKYYPELNNCEKISLIAEELYRHNMAKQKELKSNDLLYLMMNDIIYYQRDLKSQKHLISECPFEKKNHQRENGTYVFHKVASKSSPLFQEFRIWQTIHNLKITRNETVMEDGRIRLNVDITKTLLTPENKEKIFELFDERAEISHNQIFGLLLDDGKKITAKTHRLNFPEDKKFIGNETKALFLRLFRRFKKEEEGKEFVGNRENMECLWHIFYSINIPEDIEKTVIKHFKFDEDMAKYISKLPPFKKDYAAFSSKAIKKMLLFMRCGKFWDKQKVMEIFEERVANILDGVFNEEENKNSVKELKERKFKSIEDFQGLPTFLASYVVYGRHSEREYDKKYENYDEIHQLKQNELRNPVVEQIVNETLLVVRDIWKQYGRPDNIHIELARELKKNTAERQKMSRQIMQNENDRKRIVSILRELKYANAESPSDITRLRLWEETGSFEIKRNAPRFSKEPTSAEIIKYKQWGEQNYISPYTGKVIPLSKLFSREYEIEHIIPRSRFFDDSFANKTICEAEVNSYKDKMTGMEFINKHGGREIEYKGKKFRILSQPEYIDLVNKTYYGRKRRNLLAEEAPEDFLQRQLNDTRYIGSKLSELLYPVAKEDIVFTIGSITNTLKEKWGLKRVWKEIIRPRFERLEKITGEKLIEFNAETNDIQYGKDYKRIDHRHHALDALVVACTSRSHIKYLNTLEAFSSGDRKSEKYWYLVRSKTREFLLPWDSFTFEAKEKLEEIIVSHKNRMRYLTKGFNLYKKWIQDENGVWHKKLVKQEKNENLYSVKKSLFKEPLGKIKLARYKDVSLKEAVILQHAFLTDFESHTQSRIADKQLARTVNELIKNNLFSLDESLKFINKSNEWNKLKKVTIIYFKEYASKRISLGPDFDLKKIDSIPYSNHSKNEIVQILKDHLNDFNGNSKDAFSSEGLEIMERKYGKKIEKVTRYEEQGSKYDHKGKLFETDKGGNLFFIIYMKINDPFDRIINKHSTISLLDAVSCKQNGLPLFEKKEGYREILLSPNDLVYVPFHGEPIDNIDWKKVKNIFQRIYKVVSFSKHQCFFVPHFVSEPIIQTAELGANNKAERCWDGEMIKSVCFKISIDRLGNISPEL